MIHPSRLLAGVGIVLGAFAWPTLLAADEPTTAELLAEIRELRSRLGQLERLVEDRIEQPSATAPAARPAPAPPPPAPVAAKPKGPIDLSFYGFVKVDAFYDSRDTFTDAIPFWTVQENAAGSNTTGEFGLTAKESRLGVKIGGPDYAGGELRGQFEFDFYGSTALNNHHAYSPRSRHAFLAWSNGDWEVLAGKTWESYVIAFPTTINFAYYNLQGQLGLRKAQIRVTRTVKLGEDSHFRTRLAIAEPLCGLSGGDNDGDLQDDAADSGLPFFEYNLEYRTGKLRVAAAGFYGREHIDRTLSTEAMDFDAWAVILGGEIPLGDALSLKGTIWSGSNLDSAWGGIGQGINLVTGETIDATGGWVQLGWKASPTWSFNLGYSIDNPDDDQLLTGQRTSNETALVNGFFQMNSNLTLGLELLRLETRYKDQKTATATRVQSMVKYHF